MNFKHYKDAEKRMDELKQEMKTLADTIAELNSEFDSDVTMERRDEILREMSDMEATMGTLQAEHDGAKVARDKMFAVYEKQTSLKHNLTSKSIAQRVNLSMADALESRSYELAWTKAIMTGDESEARALITSEGNQMLVPKTLANRIEDALMTGGRIINLCNITDIKGIVEYPLVESKSDPETHQETTGGVNDKEKVEKEITITSVTMKPKFIAETLRTTKEFEADGIDSFWTWLNMELPDALRRVIDRKIMLGSQGDEEGIHGILTNTNDRFVGTVPSADLSFDTVFLAIAMLEDGRDENINVVMNRQTFYKNVMGLRDTSGRPIYRVGGENSEKPRITVGGIPVIFSSALPSYDTARPGDTYMAVGDFSAFTLNFPLGMNPRLIRDELTQKKKNVVEYLSEIYAAGNITRLGSFAKVTK